MKIFLGTGTGYWKLLNELQAPNRLLSYYVNSKLKRPALEKMVRSDFVITEPESEVAAETLNMIKNIPIPEKEE